MGVKEGFSIVNGGTVEVYFLDKKIGETKETIVRTNGAYTRNSCFLDTGPFVGLSYGYQFGTAGTLSTSLAYASLKGEFGSQDLVTKAITKTRGSTSGLSYGIKWSKDLRSGTTLAIGIKQNKYDFKDEDMGFSLSQDLKQNFDILYIQTTSFLLSFRPKGEILITRG